MDFSSFLEPLRLSYLVVYEKLYDWIPSYGWALVALSLVTAVILSALERQVANAVSKQKLIESILEPQIRVIKNQKTGADRAAALRRLYQRYGYNPLMSVRTALPVFAQLPFLFGAYWMLSSYEPLAGQSFGIIRDLSKSDGLLFGVHALPLLMSCFNLATAWLSPELSRQQRIQALVICLLFLILLYEAPSALLIYWTCNNAIGLIKCLVGRLVRARALPVVNAGHWFAIQAPSWTRFGGLKRFIGRFEFTPEKLYWPCAVLLGTLAVLYFPITLYESDPKAFGETASSIVKGLETIYASYLIFAYLVWIVSPAFLKKSLGLILSVLSIGGLVWAFSGFHNYGVLDTFNFQDTEDLGKKSNKYADIAVFVFSLIVISVFAYKRKIFLLGRAAWMLSLGAFVSFAYYSVTLLNNSSQTEVTVSEKKTVSIPQDKKDFWSFSQSGKNVVVIMLDMFTGSHMERLTQRHPELLHDLDGFVWYADTVTSGPFTILGKPGLLGGAEAHPFNLNQDKVNSLEEKIHSSWAKAIIPFLEDGYRVDLYDFTWLDPELLQAKVGKTPALNLDTGLESTDRIFWKNAFKFQSKNQVGQEHYTVSTPKFLSIYGVFKIAPFNWKKMVYRGGAWRNVIDTRQYEAKVSANNLAQLSVLSVLANADLDKKFRGTFKFFVNNTTHTPWGLDEACQPWVKGRVISTKSGANLAHENTEYCSIKSLTNLFEWMRKNDVYDNSVIILVSDHGSEDGSISSKLFNEGSTSRIESLLLVKGLNSKGPMRTDKNALTANWDVPRLALNLLGGQNTLPEWGNPNRRRLYLNVNEWNRGKHPKNYFDIKDGIEIRGSIFDKKNWVPIKPSDIPSLHRPE